MRYLFLLQIAQIFISIFLSMFVMIQAKGVGLSSSVGSSIGYYRTRRGVERVVLYLTLFFSVAFVTNSLLLVILS